MKIEPGQTVLLTGASGGLGTVMTRALADCGVRLALVACPGAELEDLAASIRTRGAEVLTFTSDLRNPEQRRTLVQEVRRRYGPIDLLVNNAGVEFNSFYHELSEDQINEVLNVNLVAAMILARLVLPDMLERKRGHIVNISSLAGKSGPAYQEPYAASKAALVAFTMSLRATYRELGVSASVIVPGFIETGIYTRLKQTAGRPAPPLLGACSPERVVQAMLRAIGKDTAEVIVNRYPVRPLLMLTALSPSLGAWLSAKFGTDDFFRSAVLAQKRTAPRQVT